MAEDAMFLALKSATCAVMTELPPHLLTMDVSLRELGANSVDRAEILMRVMEEQELRVSMIRFAICQSLADITKVLREAQLED